jgi:phosphatidylserine decarboxylase
MKHSNKAFEAAQDFLTKAFVILLGVLIVFLACTVTGLFGSIAGFMFLGLLIAWLLFAGLIHFFFRDPNPRVPAGTNLVVSPGHGKVDVIDETTEPEFMGGRCRRVSMFLSVLNVHVQNAPVSGKVSVLKRKPGAYLSALKSESAAANENVLIGFESNDAVRRKIGVRLVAGVVARRIVPWVEAGEEVALGDRVSLIQFGSRVEVYLPLSAKVKIKLGDKVKGGETVVAVFE